MENNYIEIDLDNEESPNRSLQSPLSSKNTNLETTTHEIRRKRAVLKENIQVSHIVILQNVQMLMENYACQHMYILG
ncbi:uncharacterized protein OCT59_015355 [Rhizophagus irregularis]|uniref:Uncharacterized protein n=1 Tax=Rhizophagus irregularis TaxID=588596 RepID=A0A2I1F5F3_9GLOM|nr:hypothetical protein RhiirB3_446303 [Rhizophagus irregularis]UZO23009.1 hypothetical protein OCT59_015355 [Rhizophagus irregularis]CAB5206891.1 unnamed protein product [Rhizophagus irregularis]CAB5354608.1 unnamed protein product [Rhizophagus irregularis]